MRVETLVDAAALREQVQDEYRYGYPFLARACGTRR
jgi:hypothetical protein